MDSLDRFIEETKDHLNVKQMVTVHWCLNRFMDKQNDYCLDLAAAMCTKAGCPFPTEMQAMITLAAAHRLKTGKTRGTRAQAEKYNRWLNELIRIEQGVVEGGQLDPTDSNNQLRRKLTPHQILTLNKFLSGEYHPEDLRELLLMMDYISP